MSERLGAVVARNTLLALVLGAVFYFVLPRRGELPWDLVDVASLGLCFAVVGWAAERAMRIVPGIDTPGGRVVRVGGWFAAGMWAYVAGHYLWGLYGRDTTELPVLWWGGGLLVVVELALHGVLARGGRSDFFGRAQP
jgi:hypothetical protein